MLIREHVISPVCPLHTKRHCGCFLSSFLPFLPPVAVFAAAAAAALASCLASSAGGGGCVGARAGCGRAHRQHACAALYSHFLSACTQIVMHFCRSLRSLRSAHGRIPHLARRRDGLAITAPHEEEGHHACEHREYDRFQHRRVFRRVKFSSSRGLQTARTPPARTRKFSSSRGLCNAVWPSTSNVLQRCVAFDIQCAAAALAMKGTTRRALAAAGVFLACCVGLTLTVEALARDSAFCTARPLALRGGVGGGRKVKKVEKEVVGGGGLHVVPPPGLSRPPATTSAGGADGRCERGTREQAARRQEQPASAALKVYMHVASAACAALFRAFLVLAAPGPQQADPRDEEAAAESTASGPASGKRRKQSATSHQKCTRAGWVLCFTDENASACPQLLVRCLQGPLEQQWTAAPGGSWWREIRDPVANGNTALGGEMQRAPTRLYGPFASKDVLTQVATLVRRLFVLRCSACSTSSRPAGRNILQWTASAEHRMAALLANAVCKEATRRCAGPDPRAQTPHPAPSLSTAGLCLAEANASVLQQGRVVEPPTGMVLSNDTMASFPSSAGDMEQALLIAQSLLRQVLPPGKNLSSAARMQLGQAADPSSHADSEKEEEGLRAAVSNDTFEPSECLRNLVAALGDGWDLFRRAACVWVGGWVGGWVAGGGRRPPPPPPPAGGGGALSMSCANACV